MHRRTLMATALLGGAGGLGRRAVAGGATAAVSIDSFSFVPARLTVAVGTSVTWSNHDDSPHTVVSTETPRTLQSPALDTGDDFAFMFSVPGSYGYFCSLHPHMQGTVIVQ